MKNVKTIDGIIFYRALIFGLPIWISEMPNSFMHGKFSNLVLLIEKLTNKTKIGREVDESGNTYLAFYLYEENENYILASLRYLKEFIGL